MFKLILDPGHGVNENIGICHGYREGNRMFVLAQLLKTAVEKYQDVQVIVTRPNLIDNPDLAARGAIAPGSNLFISLHSNAAGSDVPAGTEIYDTVIMAYRNTDLVNKLGLAISAVMGSEWRGCLHRYNDDNVTDYYGVLRSAIRSNCYSAMLIEHGFHTNPDDCTFLSDDNNLQALAEAEAATLAKWYGWQPVLVPPVDTIYRVQVGAYTSKANAISMRQRIMDILGIDAIITPLAADGFYRVQVGAYTISTNATRQAELLKNNGFPAIIKKGT